MVSIARAARSDARSAAWTVVALQVVCPALASAQVNAEVLRPDPFEAGWSAGVDASLALAKGNVEVLDVGGAARVQFQTLHALAPADPEPAHGVESAGEDAPPEVDARVPFLAQRVFVTGRGRYSERSANAFVSQAFAHARWTGMWHPRVGSDVFAQVQYNEFLRLRLRAVTGAGVRVEAVHERTFMLWGGSGYMFEHDRILPVEGTEDDPETVEHRWTNYATARLAVWDGRLLVQDTVYVQPRWDRFRDYRLLNELEVLGRVEKHVALGVTWSVLHDSAPPTRVKHTDHRLFTVLRLSF